MDSTAIPWIMLGATISAAIAAILTGWAAVANWLTARATREAMTASVLIDCLSAYTNLMRQRTSAIRNRSQQECKDYFRELFDLHWTEFQLWRERMIPDHVMNAWLSVRRRNFDPKKGCLEFFTDTQEHITVTYQQIWDELKSDEYYEATDPFVAFMNKAHTEVITDMSKLREEFKK